jgi:hypothetical protein
MDLDQTLLLFFCCCVAFIAGYGVREVISQRRRREERRIRETHEQLMRARDAATESPMKERAAQGEGASHMPAEEDEDQRWLAITSPVMEPNERVFILISVVALVGLVLVVAFMPPG